MADFVQTMKDWARMCDSMQGGIAKCDNCPLLKVLCQYKPNEKVDLAGAEKIIEKWAEDNPEPVFPTWFEVLEKFGVAGRINGEPYYDSMDREIYLKQPAFTPKAFEPVPADIAEKLGVEQKC